MTQHEPATRHDHLARIIAATAGGRAPFIPNSDFILTGFADRLLKTLQLAYDKKESHVVCARSGDGKSTTLRQFHALHPRSRDASGVARVPVLSTRVPTGRQSADALMVALAERLGAVPNIRLLRMRQSVVSGCVRAGVRMIVIDDAHELTLGQLNYLRELTDRLREMERPVTVALLAGTSSLDPADQPLWKLVGQAGLTAEQIKERLDGTDPLVLINGLSRREVGGVLATLERTYSDSFPELRLTPWTSSMFEWLTDPRVDATRSGYVRMRSICQVVESALADAWAREMPGLDEGGLLLRDAAIRLVTRGMHYSTLSDDAA